MTNDMQGHIYDIQFHKLFIHYTRMTVLRFSGFCLGQPGWAGIRRNIHPLI